MANVNAPYGFLPLQNRSVDDLKEFVKAEIARWGEIVKFSGARID